MERVFDDKYYNEGEADKKGVRNKKMDLKLMKDEDVEEGQEEEQGEDEEEEEGNEEERFKYERELTKSLKKQVEEKEDQSYQSWFACDGC